MFQIRVILIVLLTLITVLSKTLYVAGPLDAAAKAATSLFIYADLDLFLVFLMTFLPSFRRPGIPSVG